MNFSVFHEIFACFQLYIGESLTNINSRETTRQQNACVWYPKHARHSHKELGVMKQPCGARRTPPDGLPVSEENRRYLRGINFNGRYTLYNAPIELILGEPKLLVVCFKKEKMYRKYTIFLCEKFDFCLSLSFY